MLLGRRKFLTGSGAFGLSLGGTVPTLAQPTNPDYTIKIAPCRSNWLAARWPCHGNANERALTAGNSAGVMPLPQQLATRRQLRSGSSAVSITR
jgi:hypothetical protein